MGREVGEKSSEGFQRQKRNSFPLHISNHLFTFSFSISPHFLRNYLKEQLYKHPVNIKTENQREAGKRELT